jgi:hypothetical protein
VTPGHFIDHDNGMDCQNAGGAEVCDPPNGTVHYFDPDQNLPCTRTGAMSICSNMYRPTVLLSHLPLTTPGGIDLYFEWPARDRRAESLESLKATRPNPLHSGLETSAAVSSGFWRASSALKWRATADEDGQYCFAVAL